jgi:DNA repair exonuclease SbcCD ATPase subunit
MLEELLQQAEAGIRKGVRTMEADRLRGDVKVLHWNSIREVFESALSRLQAQVEQLSAKPKAVPVVVPKATPGEDLAAKAARLERELAEARKLLAEYQVAIDYYDLIEAFDIAKFEAVCEALKPKAAKAEQLASKKTRLSLAQDVEDIYAAGGRLVGQITNLMELMYGGKADLGVLIQLVRLGRDGSCLWKRLEMTSKLVDQITIAYT